MIKIQHEMIKNVKGGMKPRYFDCLTDKDLEKMAHQVYDDINVIKKHYENGEVSDYDFYKKSINDMGNMMKEINEEGLSRFYKNEKIKK